MNSHTEALVASHELVIDGIPSNRYVARSSDFVDRTVYAQQMFSLKQDHVNEGEGCAVCDCHDVLKWRDCHHWTPSDPIVRFTKDGLQVFTHSVA